MTKPSQEVHKAAPQRSQVLEVLRKMKPVLKEKYGVTHLGIFGSVARDEATAQSDVDVVFEIEQPNLFISVNIKEDLEAELKISVDLVRYRERMNTYLKARIEKEAVYV
ncbi:nucleotidyltransferase family protein [Leptolyngbya sp. BC1307]|uniref:nucleotidyltransferase family protein n=1 Tax=Leptolyngbya sp. BC1307 TaxID=2029589 RepID=UPI001981ADE2|nr:nucleotidyltransferase family protein [Leptolyngbya sp. BC1307]